MSDEISPLNDHWLDELRGFPSNGNSFAIDRERAAIWETSPIAHFIAITGGGRPRAFLTGAGKVFLATLDSERERVLAEVTEVADDLANSAVSTDECVEEIRELVKRLTNPTEANHD